MIAKGKPPHVDKVFQMLVKIAMNELYLDSNNFEVSREMDDGRVDFNCFIKGDI